MSNSSPLNPQASALYATLLADPFTRFLGATLEEVEPGYARMSLVVRPELAGPQGVTHAYNRVHLALNVNITFHSATRPGDTLTAEVQEQRAGGRTAAYVITVTDQQGTLVATSQAVVYRTQQVLVREGEE
jgi:acyl-CoA thioesterase